MCVSGCPYKKVYFNWNSGKAEKCILCYPRMEMGEAPACMHSCVGKIRYLGVVLYDADRIEETASKPEAELVEAQREMILDPFDSEVIRNALNSGIDRKIVESAQKSPIYKYVKQWRMALPLHPEWRTLPMLFYIPPLLPVTATLNQQGCYEMETDFFSSLESARLPIRYMASLFSAGDEEEVIAVYRKLLGVRIYKRAQTVGDISMETARRALEEAHLTPEDVEGIYYLTALAGADERMVVPPFLREQVIELGIDTQAFQEERGAGFLYWPKRGL
jgi:nitrate reductase beta subunit